jgi:predicted thioesterase
MEIGTKMTVSKAVDEKSTALAVGSGDMAVFATPMLAALMENAAMRLAAQFLEEGQTTVGTRLGLVHSAATPVGMSVQATAELTAVDGRVLTFSIEAADEAGPVGSCTHQRVVVDRARFAQKTMQKLTALK